MGFRFDVYLHRDTDRDVHCKLDELLGKVTIIMARIDDLNAELIAANEATNEIASDLADLIARLAAGGLTDSEAADVQAQLSALRERLQGVAATHTPGTPPA